MKSPKTDRDYQLVDEEQQKTRRRSSNNSNSSNNNNHRVSLSLPPPTASINNSDNISINMDPNNNNNNKSSSKIKSPLSDTGERKLTRINSSGEDTIVLSPKDEKDGTHKIVNRANNLTQSDPSLNITCTDIKPPSPVNNGATTAVNSNNGSHQGGLHTATSFPEIQKHPLGKAQELYHVVSVGDDDDDHHHHHHDGGDPPPSDDEDDGDEEKKVKKKKRGFFRQLFTTKFMIIIILLLLVLVSAVGVVFRIFWEDVEIVDVVVLRWALYIDICVFSYMAVYFIIRGFISLFESTLYLQQHVYYYINGLVRPLSCLIWAIIVYFATDPVLQLPDYVDDDMDKFFIFLRAVMYVSLFYCGRVALVKVLAARTNRKAFYTSLKRSLLNEELLDQLSTKNSKNLTQTVSTSIKKKKRMGITLWIESLKKRNQLSGKLSSIAENYTQKDAKIVAKRILANADRARKGYLVKDDLKYYVKAKHLDKAFDTIGSLHDNIIKRDDLINWILRVVRSRKTLEYRLRDHEDIGRVINEIVNFIFWILMFLFVMTLYGYEASVFLVPLSTTILGLSFAFGTTLRNVFESLVLIFFVRPFEAGDKVVLGNLEPLIVDKIGILFTSFISWDGKAVYMPNPVITAARIENHQRSEEVSVSIDVTVNFNTPIEKLYGLEAKFDKWVKAQPEKWRPDVWMSFASVLGTNQITLKYGGSIIASWQDSKRWRPCKNEFYIKMKDWISEANLETYPARQQIELLHPIPIELSHFQPPVRPS
ncbi:hypothetical protein CYY_000836 [Polysphondylium violaceum]|uniref:Mechanosensitive ion channel MscS domain-containing protein n=1 Tax=Polysphondylium violaceum TaxID=133409 RepID=A0A8J4Q468_9MYCE|nr:hypothetical protein CYY_000836 [Polysphondylium violaceum]